MAAAAAIGLCEDDRGIPRSLPLLAALVEEDARLHAAAAAAAASQPAGSDLVRAFRGRTVPKVPIRDFLERIYVLVRSEAATGQVIRVDGTCFVLAGVYLTRFIGSHAARVAGIVVEPSTAHRLVAVALFLGGHSPKNWAAVFEAASDRAIRTGEIAGLEERFLRAISSRLFVDGYEFKCFCGVLEKVPLPPRGSCASRKRQADAMAGDEEEEHRRVRTCLPPPTVMSN
ncbi:cyclin-P4-1-like [Miscanthus floridulus]|uniref:cyclin-P4-1-like n=1 Tax=Miscanthus floridulus TaxID=154761 RepID=UPI003458E89B